MLAIIVVVVLYGDTT